MSESAGEITYTVDMETAALMKSTEKTDESLDKLQAGFDKTDASAKKFTGTTNKTAGAMNPLSAAIKRVTGSAEQQSSAMSKLTKIISGYLALKVLQSSMALADQYTDMASRIRNATDSTEEYEKVQARLLQTANGTYRSLAEAQEVYLSTADVLRDLGYATSEVLDITDSMSYAFVRDAARADQATNAMDAYSKSLMKGKIDADAWASILAATPSIVQGIALATGETTTKIRELGATGKLSTEALSEGFRQSMEVNKEFAAQMDATGRDAFIALQNSVQVFIGKMNESSGATAVLVENVGQLSAVLQDPETIEAAQALAGAVVSAFTTIIESAKETVKFTKWLAEEMAATFGGPASDDIVRLEENLATFKEMLASPIKRIRSNEYGGLVLFRKEEIEKNIATTQALIDEFYKNQEESAKRATEAAKESTAATEKQAEPIKKLVSATNTKIEVDKKAKEASDKLKASQEQNADTLKKLEQNLILAALSGEQLAIKQAELSLNEYATPQQIESVKKLAAEIYKITELQDQKKEFGVDVKGKIRGEFDPLQGGPFDDQTARYDAEAAEEQKRYADQLERLKSAKQLELEVVGGYQALEQQMAQEHADRLMQIELAKKQVMLAAIESSFGAATDAIGDAFGKQSGMYKAAFLAQKVAAIAQAALAIQTGIAMAAANPFPYNLAAMASVAAATAGIVSNIQSISMGSGRQYGGPVSANSMHRVNENGRPEIFNAANGRQYMIPNQRGEVVSNRNASRAGSKGGGGMQVTIGNITLPGVTNAQEGLKAAGAIGRTVSAHIAAAQRYN